MTDTNVHNEANFCTDISCPICFPTLVPNDNYYLYTVIPSRLEIAAKLMATHAAATNLHSSRFEQASKKCLELTDALIKAYKESGGETPNV